MRKSRLSAQHWIWPIGPALLERMQGFFNCKGIDENIGILVQTKNIYINRLKKNKKMHVSSLVVMEASATVDCSNSCFQGTSCNLAKALNMSWHDVVQRCTNEEEHYCQFTGDAVVWSCLNIQRSSTPCSEVSKPYLDASTKVRKHLWWMRKLAPPSDGFHVVAVKELVDDILSVQKRTKILHTRTFCC